MFFCRELSRIRDHDAFISQQAERAQQQLAMALDQTQNNSESVFPLIKMHFQIHICEVCNYSSNRTSKMVFNSYFVSEWFRVTTSCMNFRGVVSTLSCCRWLKRGTSGASLLTVLPLRCLTFDAGLFIYS